MGKAPNCRNQKIFDLSNFKKQQKARMIMPGFPSEEYFTTINQIEEYFSGDTITCLHCGKQYKILSVHLIKSHGILPDEYRKKYGLPYTRGLIAKNIENKISLKQKELYELQITPLSNKEIRNKGMLAAKKSLELNGARVQPFIGNIRANRDTKNWGNVIKQDEINSMIEDYKKTYPNKMTIDEICKKYNHSKSTLHKKLKENNIPFRGH